jgi:acyl carrier protein
MSGVCDIRSRIAAETVAVLQETVYSSQPSAFDKVLRRIFGWPTQIDSIDIDNHAHFFRDLRIDHEAFSFDFCPAVEQKFGVKIPIDEWNRVTCVDDVVACLLRRGVK